MKRITYLDGLRGIAIAMVVLYHALKDAFPNSPTRFGAMGVELFFMISGFVILLTLEKCGSFQEFFARRWMRLYPAMLIACIVWIALSGFAGWPAGANIAPGLTLIDDRWYSWALGRDIKSLDGAYWTLYLEMRFYVIFGLAYFMLGTKRAIGILIAMGLVYTALLLAGRGLGVWRWTDLHFEAWFAAGTLFYLWSKEPKARTLCAAIATGLLAAWIYYPSFGPRAVGVVLVGLFALAVTMPRVQAILSSRVAVWMGAISYPLYLVHSQIIGIWGLAGIPIALVLAHLIARYGEPWLRERVKASRLAPAP